MKGGLIGHLDKSQEREETEVSEKDESGYFCYLPKMWRSTQTIMTRLSQFHLPLSGLGCHLD